MLSTKFQDFKKTFVDENDLGLILPSLLSKEEEKKEEKLESNLEKNTAENIEGKESNQTVEKIEDKNLKEKKEDSSQSEFEKVSTSNKNSEGGDSLNKSDLSDFNQPLDKK